MSRLALDPEGLHLALPCGETLIAVLPTLDGAPAATRFFGELTSPLTALAWDPFGGDLLAAEDAGPVQRWRLRPPEGDPAPSDPPPWRILPHPDAVERCIATASGGVVTVDWRYRVRWWRPEDEGGVEPREIPVTGIVGGLAPAPGNERVWLRTGFDLVLFDLGEGVELQRRELLDGRYLDSMEGHLELSRRGRRLLAYWDDGWVLDTAEGEVLASFPFSRHAAAAAVADPGEVMVLGFPDGTVEARHFSGEVLAVERLGDDPVADLEISDDGAVVAWADEGGRAAVYDLAEKRYRLEPQEIRRALASALNPGN